MKSMKIVLLREGLSLSGWFFAAALMMVSCKPHNSQTNPTALSTTGMTEVPGYIVELVEVVEEKSLGMAPTLADPTTTDRIVTDAATAVGSGPISTSHQIMAETRCIGAHIGEGFILTASHCIFDLVCKAAPMLDNIRLRYRTSDGTTQGMPAAFIEAMAFHSHRAKVSSDKTLLMPGLSVEHDIALIKVSNIPFFESAARIPLPSEQQFAPTNISGMFNVFRPQHMGQATTTFSGWMDSVMISSKSNTAAVMTSGGISEWLKPNPMYEDFSLSLERYSPANIAKGYPSCYALGANGALEDISPYSFSADGDMRIDPSLETVLSQMSAHSEQLVAELEKPAYDRNQTLLAQLDEYYANILMASNEHGVVIESGGAAEFCPGQSGGPVVQSSEGKDDVVVAVMSHGLTHSHDDEGEVSSKCSQLEGTVSTFYNLSWIHAAKARMLAGELGKIEPIYGSSAKMEMLEQ